MVMLSIGGVYFLISAICSPTPSTETSATLEDNSAANLQAVLGMPPGGRALSFTSALCCTLSSHSELLGFLVFFVSSYRVSLSSFCIYTSGRSGVVTCCSAAALMPGVGGPDPKKLFKAERDALQVVVSLVHRLLIPVDFN